MTDRDERLGYVHDALEVLFPGSSAAGGTAAPTEPRREFALLPSARHPRLLVPLAPRGGAAAALRAYGGRLSRRDRIAYGALANALAVTSRPFLRTPRFTVPSDVEGVDDHLSDVLGSPISVAVHLTPDRANRKPILQALAHGARYPAGFAKIGEDPLTDELVAAEAAALRRVGADSRASIVVPEVISDAAWGGHSMLVMRPLPTWAGGRPPTAAELTTATQEIASLGDPATVVLRESSYWKRLAADVETVPDPAKRDALRDAAERIDSAFGGADVQVGGAHGDWSPWNMWRTSEGLLVWDWERFTTDSPVGSDHVHYRLQELLVAGDVTVIDAARGALAAAATPIVGVLHLFALAVRYDKDGQRARPTGEWLLPVVHEATANDPHRKSS